MMFASLLLNVFHISLCTVNLKMIKIYELLIELVTLGPSFKYIILTNFIKYSKNIFLI